MYVRLGSIRSRSWVNDSVVLICIKEKLPGGTRKEMWRARIGRGEAKGVISDEVPHAM